MRVLIAAGGTAGHINPALAIAGAIKKADPSAEIHFAGRKEGMEYRLVTQAGYPFHHIEITGFQRRLSLNNIKRNIITLWNLALSGPKARAMMKEVQPDLVIGCGGYVSGPVVRCAAKKGIKTAIHEQNAFPGVTNKLLAPDVDIVFAAVPAAVEKLGAPEKTQVVGNPVRPEVFEKAGERDAIRAQLGAGDRTVILSFGGSLGARRVNEVVADLCAWEQKEHKPVLHIHATGQYGVELFQNLEKEKGFAPGESLVVKEYINNMPELLAAADLVISRAGALTLAELEAEGRAAILIPSPNVAENHQYYNAMELQKAGAAVVIEEKDLTGEKLVSTVSGLLAEPGKLAAMGKNARTLSVDDSLDRIADADRTFELNASNYPLESMDSGDTIDNGAPRTEKTHHRHLTDPLPEKMVDLFIDYRMMGVGGDDSWGATAHEPYLIRPGKENAIEYGFSLVPFDKKEDYKYLIRQY